MKNKLTIILFFICTIFLLGMSVKGDIGNPIYFQTEKDRVVGGPFESTNSTSRYALVEAIVENGTVLFNHEQAQFSAPDLVSFDEKLFTIFTPGVSLVGVPFYILGKQFGLPQLFTYFSTALFAILNVWLIAKVGRILGANLCGSLLGGILFLFGTNALPYAHSFTQHHISTSLILLALLNAVSKRTILNNILFAYIFSAGLLMDIPNGLMMLPLVLYVLYKQVSVSEKANKLLVSVKLNFIALVIGLIPLISFFAWYNYHTSGSMTRLSQSIGRVDYTEEGVVERAGERGKVDIYDHNSVYDTRNQLNGIYTLLISDERGWFYYSPIIVIGFLGIAAGLMKKEVETAIPLIISIVSVSIVSYASFGDPWGGWSFGPRYLIPATALVCTGIGVAIQKYKKNPLFIAIFFVLAVYSVSVNSLGAMTTSAIPPKVEAIHLPDPIPYTYLYNLEFVEENRSSSLLYNAFIYKYTSFKYYLVAFIAIMTEFILVLYAYAGISKKREMTS